MTIDGEVELISPEQVLSKIIKDIKSKAIEQTKLASLCSISVSLPQHVQIREESQHAFRRACGLAGLENVRFHSWQSAVISAYQTARQREELKDPEKLLLVVHMGQNTLKLSVIRLKDDLRDYEVL